MAFAGSGCGSTDAGGQPTSDAAGQLTSGTVGELVPTIETLSVNVNRVDGFMAPAQSDAWAVDVATRAVTLNAGVPVTATVEQIQGLIGAVASSAYRFNASCLSTAIDGAPFPPRMTASGGGATHQFGVSDNTCARTDHSYPGDVLSCAEFGAIYDLLEAIAPSGVALACMSYW
jgi:hypothetical protein